MKRSTRLAQELRKKLADARAITELAEKESRDLTDDEQKRADALLEECTQLEAQVKAAEQAEQRMTALQSFIDEPNRPAPPIQIDPEPRKAPAAKVGHSRPYSLARAIISTIPGEGIEAKVERYASDQLREFYGADEVRGLLIPPRAFMTRVERLDAEKRDVEKTGTASGASLIATDFLGQEFIEILRNKALVMMAGARMLPGLVGDVSIPRQNAASAGGWLSTEAGAITESNLTTNTLSLSPKDFGVKTELTRRMVKQAAQSVSLDELVAQDLRAGIALAIDLAALHGSGASGQPTGVSATGGIGGVTTAGAITITHIVEFLTDLATGNALQGALQFFCRAAVWGILKRKEKATNTGIFLCDDENRVEGYPVNVTEQVNASTLIFGNWNEVLIGMWGGLDMFADPYSAGDNGLLRVRAYQTVDIGVRHAASFTLASDVTG